MFNYFFLFTNNLSFHFILLSLTRFLESKILWTNFQSKQNVCFCFSNLKERQNSKKIDSLIFSRRRKNVFVSILKEASGKPRCKKIEYGNIKYGNTISMVTPRIGDTSSFFMHRSQKPQKDTDDLTVFLSLWDLRA